MSFSYLFDPNKQFQDRNGVNNVGGFLRVYIDGTDDRATTYKDFNGTLNESDIMLDTDGRAVVIVDDNLTFRIEVYERNGSLLWTVTNFTARGEGGGGGSSTPVVVDGTANEINVTENMTAGVKYYTVGLATAVKNVLAGLISSFSNLATLIGNKKDKQTPVTDPSASGAGLEFIDSVTQDANGVITPHKKTVQDGTTAQKGVVQLQDSIGSTESSTDKAVTPHAVRAAINSAVSSAYHAAGTKTVAQLTSSLLVAENEGCVYNVTDSGTTTSDFVDGAGHPINAGDNVGVCDVGGGVYKFDLLSGFVDLSNYLAKTGDASNTTATFTKASGDTSTMTSGGKLSAIFTAISSFFASLKALAFKDEASYSDLSSGVQSSLDKADSALQSHQSVTDSDPTLSWGTRSKVGSVGSTELHVTMPSNPASGKLDTSGDGSNVSVTPDGTSTGTDIGSSTTLKAWAQKFKNLVGALKALAFKDKVSDGDINGTISDSHIASASTWNGKADKASVTGATKCKITYNSQGIVTAGADLAASDIPSLAASKITSGTFGTSFIADDAITAAKVKDNETLPVNISGNAGSAQTLPRGFAKFWPSNTGYKKIAELNPPANHNDIIAVFEIYETLASAANNSFKGLLTVRIRNDSDSYSYAANFTNVGTFRFVSLSVRYDPSTHKLLIFAFESEDVYCGLYAILAGSGGWRGNNTNDNVTLFTELSAESVSTYTEVAITANRLVYASPNGVGSDSTPVYVNSNGQVQPCTPSGGVMKSNTAELYIAGYVENIPYYNVRNIKNGCVNHVDFSGITNSTCNITFEAPTLSTGEEYDYIISLEGYTNNSGYSTGSVVENCKQVLRYDYVNNLWIGEPLFLQATDWRQICVVRGNTCEWKRVTLS